MTKVQLIGSRFDVSIEHHESSIDRHESSTDSLDHSCRNLHGRASHHWNTRAPVGSRIGDEEALPGSGKKQGSSFRTSRPSRAASHERSGFKLTVTDSPAKSRRSRRHLAPANPALPSSRPTG